MKTYCKVRDLNRMQWQKSLQTNQMQEKSWPSYEIRVRLRFRVRIRVRKPLLLLLLLL